MSSVTVLPERLTLDEARQTLQQLSEAIEREGPVASLLIDASPLKVFDTSALAVLLACRRLAEAAGQAFRVDGVPAPLAELAGLYGIDDLLGFTPVGNSLTDA